jgi:hypothetical protein
MGKRILEGFRVCRCGCETIFRRRSYNGNEAFFLMGHNQKGIYHSQWNGGKFVSDQGYIKAWCPDHPHNRLGYVREHRLVMEAYLGRYLDPRELVHHIDGNRKNNVIDNLELVHNEEHISHHKRKEESKPNG